MPVAIITGSGTHSLPGFEPARTEAVTTPFGASLVTAGRFAGADVLHLSRHGAGHVRLSNQVTHRANIWALRSLDATAVLACTACGAVDPTLALGSLVVFDDLHFPSNRLPDGSLCTFFSEPGGDPIAATGCCTVGRSRRRRERRCSPAPRRAGVVARSGGTYGHVDGPRFNTPSEIASLAACGVTAVSQTGGPETVLCGELELPYALIGFVTDYANEVIPGEPTPVRTLSELMAASTEVLADVLAQALVQLDGRCASGRAAGTMLRSARAGGA